MVQEGLCDGNTSHVRFDHQHFQKARAAYVSNVARAEHDDVSREWDELTSKEEKMAYIRQLLTSTPSASLS